MTRTESGLSVSGKQKQEKGSKMPPFLPLPHMRTRPDDAMTPISYQTFISDIDTAVDSTLADDSITGFELKFLHENHRLANRCHPDQHKESKNIKLKGRF
ncbi:unnamed protein product [Lactuca saligna]|uniref:Uncharacterized protein n=1 Tax=Lactuca saligna TaxID=75948 RepID=A0AA36ECM4_LACSI|nr:unnamed protein product [Lactuca saligna]